MALGDGTAANGGLSLARFDASTVLALLVLAALIIVLGVHMSVSASLGKG
ncbi:MAG: hypothetical protein ABSC73_09350 [Acidimicrobiales bacterium]|jgi:hypothetical protein